MPSRSGPREGVGTAAFTTPEWSALVALPRRVIVAATSAEADDPRRTVAEGLAGLEAVAAGRAFDSDLVRAVVADFYAETEGDPTDGETPVAEEFADRAAGLAAVLHDCREATRVLGRADPADSAAYRQWIQWIAARVCAAARSGGVLGVGGEQVSTKERRFLADLGTALALG
jgi:hypothetical protein